MAELTYVKSGERIAAHTINNIIDTLGGPSIPSDGEFIGTSSGALFRKSYSVGTGIANKNYEFLDVKFAEAPAALSCVYKNVYINLGRDEKFAKEKLDTNHIFCYDGDAKTGFEVTAKDFYINGTSENDNPNFYDGYVCTKISSLQQFSVVKSYGEEKYVGYGDGTLYGYKFKTKKADQDDSVFVITNEYEEDYIKGFLDGEGYSEHILEQKRSLAIVTNSNKGKVIIKIPNDVEFETNEDIRFRLRAREEKRQSSEGNTESRYHIEYYNGFFLKSDNTEDTGIRWNNRQFQNIMPNLALEWHELTATEWGKEPDDYTVYINLTATYQSTNDAQEDFHGQYEVSLEPKEENRIVEEGTNSISATYIVGTLKYRNGYEVDQNILGEQTFIEMFDDNAISSAVDDIVPEVLSSYLPKVDSEVQLLQLSSIGKYSYEDDKAGKKDVYEIHQFHNLDNQVTLNDERKKYSDIIIRTRSNTQDNKPAIVEYLPLSALSASSAAEISVDSDFKNQTSSLQLLSTDIGEWYQLYNFDKKNADINAKIWTLGDLDSDKRGKTGKLIDPTTKKLLSVDILVRDNSTKQLKYMNLSVDPINVDTYSTNTKNKSLVYNKDNFKDRDYLTLYDFNTTPETKLSATINNNGLVDVTGQNTWILTKKYNPSNQMMELAYDRLQLSVDLSGVSADVRCDADVTLAQKSIHNKGDCIQLYNFARPEIGLYYI